MCPIKHDRDAMQALLREQRATLLKVLAVLGECPNVGGNSYALREEVRRLLDRGQAFTGPFVNSADPQPHGYVLED